MNKTVWLRAEGGTLAAPKLKELWRKEYFQTFVTIALILAIVLGFWFGSQLVLHSEHPALAVASGSMCILPGPSCDGWTHPFEHTLHVGDLIIVQGVNPADIYAAPYNTSGRSGDIIVFNSPYSNDLIVHRAIAKREENGSIYFTTKGDGNSGPDSEIPASSVIGKVVLRIPWFGHIALFMQRSSGIYIVVALIVLLVVIEFVVPVFTKAKSKAEPKESGQKIETET
jgi:signal peptidase